MHRSLFLSNNNEIENSTIGQSDDDIGFRVYYSIEVESHLAKLNVKFYLI